MTPPRFRVLSLTLLAAGLTLAGCGQQHPPTAQVLGKVFLDGEPLTTGSVLFIPDPTGQYASGRIKEDGTFTLTTFNEGDGALLGKHKVSVTAVGSTEIGQPLIAITPQKYGNENTSGLTAEIEKGKNEIELQLANPTDKKRKK